MSVLIVSEYRLLPGRGDEFLDVLRAHREQSASLSARMTACEVMSGGESAGHVAVTIEFATPLERGEYVDKVIATPGQSPLDEAIRVANPVAVLIARYSANGIPLAAPPAASPSPVVSELRLRITPGRHPEADAAINDFKRTRDDLGIACWQSALISAGTYHGLRILNTGGATFAEHATHQDRLTAFNRERGTPGGNGGLTQAQQSGAVTLVDSRISRLMTEL